MTKSSLSILVFAIYLAILSVAFIFFPNPFIMLFGFEETTEIWIRILGFIIGVLAFYFFMAIVDNATHFYRRTVYTRLSTLPVFLAFIVLGMAPPVLLLFGIIDAVCALWTAWALKNDDRG